MIQKRVGIQTLFAVAVAVLLLNLSASATPREQFSAPLRLSTQAPDGAKVFAATCAACHQPNGMGLEDKYPPLAGSEWVQGSENRMIRIVLHGLTGEIEVQGETHTGLMVGLGPTLDDAEIAAVTSYVRRSFGNKAPPITTATVTKIRAATAARKTPWTAPELLKIP